MKKHKAAIIGMGAICSIGKNRSEIIENIKKNKHGLKELSAEELSKLKSQIAGSVNIDHEKIPNDIIDRNSQLAYLAFKEALIDSKIDISKYDPYRIAIVYGTCNADIQAIEKSFSKNNIMPDDYSDLFLKHFYGADLINKHYKVKGQKISFVTACAASNQAIGYSMDLINYDEADLVIALGSDSLSNAAFGGFNALQALSNKPCSPFSTTYGISLGEGAGALIIQKHQSALKEGNKIYGQIAGYSFNSDAYHATRPHIEGEGAKKAMEKAIKDSGLNHKDISVVCAHATGTEANDKVESKAIKECFIDSYNDVLITGIKSFFGHTLGASGILQFIVMIDSMKKQFVPPIVNFKQKREFCDLNFIINKTLNKEYQNFICNSFAFGGNNVSTVFSEGFNLNTKELDSKKEKIVISGYSLTTPIIDKEEDLIKRISSKGLKNKKNKTITYKEYIIKNKNFRKFGKTTLATKIAIDCIDKLINKSNFKQNELNDIGLLFGITKGPIKVFEKYYKDILNSGIEYASAQDFQHIVMNSIAGQVAIALGIKGVNTTISSQFSPMMCLKYAYELLSNKKEKNPIIIASSDELSNNDKLLLPKASYYKDVVFSEGGGGLLVETEKTAINNDRPVLAEISSFNSTSFPPGEIDLKNYKECIMTTLNKENITINEIDIHIQNTLIKSKKPIIDVETINLQDEIGTLESTSSIVNIIYGLKILNNEQNITKDKKIHKILVSSYALNGSCNSFILKKEK